ncbi:MAG: response regulator [Pseudomonas lundensis]|uniref:Hpt domain-containing protein n=1 Tax=Pseudomonas lundensis TaxID=86185 RepID=UPI0014741F04|nr:Hpt domain-containing protein [Pseudomonas lundensis]NLU02784.1 response regulator [Pseudomonas lundensis]NNA28482.1 response regulator [Pseudomonas lundensis]NNA37911.1 response regulator [Pseudomonas lundensis]
MVDRHDYVALEWVKDEIGETLKLARAALDGYALQPSPQALAQCLACVHQVHGSLLMVEFYGAALLAEEMEQLVMALQHGRVSQLDEAVRVLQQAFNQLPLYLDRVHSARRDWPLVVLPLINDLRTARGQPLLAQTSLFSPPLQVLAPLAPEALAQLPVQDVSERVPALRQHLQSALLGLLREDDVPGQLAQLAEVFAQLETLCRGAPLNALWTIASALVEGMLKGKVANSPALRSLLRETDKPLQRLHAQGIEAVNQPASDRLVTSLLFYIAKAERPTPKMLSLKALYELDEAMPDAAMVDAERARLAGPDRDAMRSVVAALCEELVRVKERLDLFVRSDRTHVSELSSLLAPLRQIADTLAVLGFGQPRKVIIDQLAVVQSLAQGQREPTDPVLMDVAAALLYVEATLAGMVGSVEPSQREESRLPTTDLMQIHQLVIKEARLVFDEAKDLINDYLTADYDRGALQAVPGLLTQIRGALAMIPLNRAASLLQACDDYLCEHLLLGRERPDARHIDHFADALVSIEYYLERLALDPGAAGEAVLDRAENSLIALGYAPAERNVPLLDDILSPTEVLVMEDLQELQDPQVVQSLADVLASPVSALNPPAQHIPGSLLPPPVDEVPVDEELLEVFLEETDEVLMALHEALPQWVANPADSNALSELRRGFHTLKGSGRMVRALVLGELAWAVENLLNRVIERSVAPGPAIHQLLEDTLVILPELIQAFAERDQRQRDDVDALAARAHQLSQGDPLPLLIEQDSPAFDPQLLEIFRQEAQTHLDTLNRFLDQASAHMPLHASDDLQRAVHTLKGSAHMAGVLPMAELAAPLDHLVREYKAHHVALDLDEIELLLEADGLLHRGLKQLDVDPLADIQGARSLIERTECLIADRLDALLNATGSALVPKRDPQRITAFLEQGMDTLFDAEDLLRHWRQHPHEREGLDTLLDLLTAFGEAAHALDLSPVDALCEALLDLYGAVEESSLAVSDRFFDVADDAHEALINMLDQLAAGQEITPQPTLIHTLNQLLHQGLAPDATGLIRREGGQTLDITELGAATAQLDEIAGEDDDDGLDDEIVAIFLEEAVDILESAGQALQRWLSEPDSLAPLSSLQRDLHTLKGGARMAGVVPVGDLAHELEHLYEGLLDRRANESPALAQLLVRSHQHLALMLEHLQQQQPLREPFELIEAIRGYRHPGPPVAGQPAAEADPTSGADPELLEIFLEEAFDILESSGAALARWQAEPQNTLEVENLLRDLHTLKGGARMVEITAIGDFAHELETLLEDVSAGVVTADAELFALLQGCHDRTAQMLDALRSGQPLQSPQDLIARIRSTERSDPQAPQPPAPSKAEASATAVTEGERTGLDTVKVPAELLEDMVNLSGETSMIRGRIEQQINDGHVALNEMQTTLERMRDQLRRLDIETQGRLHNRPHSEAEGLAYDEFDPLEMDRHSQLQQLSRALFESASDLFDLKATLAARNQDAHNLLQKQARVNTQLQEGLMGTRMVPFERVLPRLKRVVRQVASELGKQVEFSVINAEAEIDRNVLERMVAPLEHMLRNAVDHGLEPAEVRHASGKPEQGMITLELSNEGGDVVFDIRDDGAGVPLEAVRRKAIHRGLLDPLNSVSDRDVLQFILQPGFSTAEKITQISGRGVGMDVVHEEVRQLGGSMTLDSVAGQGVHFQIRLPFSVSLNRALMVQCADEQYAIALNTVEGIVRVMPSELESYYQLNPPLYHYGGQTYELRYLGELLQTVVKPKLAGETHSLPVLLVHCQDMRVALQVDALAGSREIVVKSLGPQFAAVQGLSGATILGDGRVVLILDLLAYIRAHQVRQPLLRAQHEAGGGLEFIPAVRPPLVLVVDDSVTVRKVTSRLLERNGMNVITAKDGVDAMSVLEEHTPDLMLLDIEMPRMDGFEVATHVRNDPRLKDMPIIMITSRTGQKHQNRAMAIGVNDYLGKPYQESVLLERIAYWSTFHA